MILIIKINNVFKIKNKEVSFQTMIHQYFEILFNLTTSFEFLIIRKLSIFLNFF